MVKKLFAWFRNALVLLWVLFLLLIGAKLAQQNQEMLEISILAWRLPEISVGVVITLSFLTGVAFSLIALLPGFYFLKLKLRRANAKRHSEIAESDLLPGRRSQL